MSIKPEDLARMSGLTARILSMIAVFDMALSTDPAMAHRALDTAVLASRELRQLAAVIGLDNHPPSLMLVEAPEPEPLDDKGPEDPTPDEPTPPEPATA